MTHLFATLVLAIATQTTPAPAETPAPTPVESMRQHASAMAPLVKSPLAKSFLEGVACLESLPAPRAVMYNKETRDAVTESAAAPMTAEALAGYEKRELTDQFYWFTRYGTPIAFVRPLEILGRAGVASADNLKLADFGFGSIGQLKVLGGLGADAVGIEVDNLLKALYSQPGDTGAIARCAAAGAGDGGSVRTVYGMFPSDEAIVSEVGEGYDVFISKNTLKRGYIHPEQEVDPRMLVHLNVTDEAYVRAVYDLLKPGGFMLIYNLSPAPAKEGEKYKPWADGRCPFARDVFEKVGFDVVFYDEDDNAEARSMGRALGWADQMDLEKDLFGTYTLVQKK